MPNKKALGRPKAEKKMTKMLPGTKVEDDVFEAARAKSQRTGVPLTFVIRKAVRSWAKEPDNGASAD